MKKMKIISIVWGIVAILLFAALTTVGFVYKNKVAKYKDLEEKIEKAAQSYTSNDFNFPLNSEEIIITGEELIDSDSIDEISVDGNKCDAYVILTFKNVTNYKGYVKCQKYETKNFNKKNL